MPFAYISGAYLRAGLTEGKHCHATQWMKNAWFDHKAHQLVDCTECHTEARKSQKTEDVLLPGIATCQKCHSGGQNAAVSQCYECHVYHDWSKAKPVNNTSTISK